MLESIVRSWLPYQCEMIPRVTRGFVALGTGSADAAMRPTVAWPDAGSATDTMIATARLATARGSTVVRGETGSAEGELLNVASPLLVDGEPVGVVSLQVAQSAGQQRAVTQLLAWGTGWLQALVETESLASRQRFGALRAVLAAGERASSEAFQELAARLPDLVGCARASVGARVAGAMRVQAISGAGRPRRQAELVRRIEAVMEEALAQDATVVCHRSEQDVEAAEPVAAAALAVERGSGAVCCVLARSLGEVVGAIVLERTAPERFDARSVELTETTATLLGPLVDVRRRETLSPIGRLWRAARSGDGARRRAASAGLAIAALVSLAIPLPHRVTATASIESAETRALVAPQDGFLASAPHRAGARVERGAVLATLDDGALTLESRKLEAERDQLRKEHRGALVGGDRARTRILEARLAQTEAGLALARTRLERTRVEAPFDGLIVSGDLSQALGAPVDEGAVLFQIAPASGHRAVLAVDERDISSVRAAQPAKLVLAAAPGVELGLRVALVTPVSAVHDGRNSYRVEALIDGPPAGLRPGMTGIAKIEVGERSLGRILAGPLLDRLRLLTWRWVP